MQCNLLRGLRCGLGDYLPSHYVRAALLIRANTLAKGASSVRLEVLQRFVTFLNHGLTPRVHCLGSIGASGDLVPLSYIASAIIGLDDGVAVESADGITDCLTALRKVALAPIDLRPKEGLALVNGTSVLSGIAALATHAFSGGLELTLGINALMCQALQASTESFDAYLHQLKPHPGQIKVAAVLRALLQGPRSLAEAHGGADLRQDQYSIRCIPQYFGPLVEGVQTMVRQIEVEINAADDNPLADVGRQRFVHGGNFYGQYVSLAMDQLRQYIALCAKQLDVQISLLATPEFSRGLPASLSVGNNEIMFGLKGLQIAGNSVLPRLMHLANPIAQLYPTHAEQFNQNINSQGFNAALLADESTTLFLNYLSVALLFGIQGVELRAHQMRHSYDATHVLSPSARALYSTAYAVMRKSPDKECPLVYIGGGVAIDTLIGAVVADLKSSTSKLFAAVAGHLSRARG